MPVSEFPPDGWEVINGSWGIDYDLNTTITNRNGDATVEVKPTTAYAGNRQNLIGWGYIPISGGDPYRVRSIVQVSRINAGDNVMVQIFWYDAAQSYISASASAYAPLSAAGAWKELSHIANAPSNARYARPVFSKAKVDFTAYVDVLMLDEKEPGFNAYVSPSTLYANGQRIIFNNEEYDWGSNYDHTTGYFTAPSADDYLFNCQLDLRGNGVNKYGTLVLYKNAAPVRNGSLIYAPVPPNKPLGLTLSATIPLLEGDYVNIVIAYDTTPGPLTVFAGSGGYNSTSFSGVRLK